MNSYKYDRGGLFGNRWRLPFWLLPLLIGLGIGALAFGVLPALGAGLDGHGGGRHRHGFSAPHLRQQPDAAAGGLFSTPQANAAGRQGAKDYAYSAGEHGQNLVSWFGMRLFAPLLSLQSLVPVLLIGAGAWLLSRRPNGPGDGGTPRPGEPPVDSEPPATGETRRL